MTHTSRMEIVIEAGKAESSLNALRNVLNSAQESLNKISATGQTAGSKLQQLGDDCHKLSDKLKGVKGGADNAEQGVKDAGHAAKTASNQIDDLGDSADNAGKKLNQTGNSGSSFADKMKSMAGGLGVAIGGGFTAIVTGAISAQREFDQLNAQLVTSMGGNKEAASQAFKEIQAFAKQTPYGLQQATEGFVKLKNLGLDANVASLKSYGNTAAAMGKDLSQMIEAVADASTGEFERLKEFGIKAKKQGENVEFTFQGVTTKVKNNSKDIQKYLLEIGNTKFAGGMELLAQSLDGSIAGFQDSWQSFMLTVSQSGIGDMAAQGIRALTDGIEWLTEKIENPPQGFLDFMQDLSDTFDTVKTALEPVGEALSSVFDFMTNDPAGQALSSAILIVAGAFGVMMTVVPVVTATLSALGTVFAVVGAAMGVLFSPITLIVAGITALVAAGVYLYNNWDTVKAKAGEVWTSVTQTVSTAWENIKSYFTGIGEWFAGIWDGVTSTANSAMDGVSSAFSTVQEAFSTAWNGLTEIAGNIWNEILAAVETAIDGIASVIKGFVSIGGTLFSGWFTAVKATFTTGWELIKGTVTLFWNSFKAIVTAQFTIVAAVFNAGFDIVKNVFTTVFNVIKALINGDMQGVKQAFKTGWDNAVATAKNLVSDIMAALSGLKDKLLTAGRDAVAGFVQGVKDKISSAVAAAKEMASNVLSGVKDALVIRSPSRKMKKVGEQTAEGLEKGIDKGKAKAVKAAKKMAQEVADAVKGLQREIDLWGNKDLTNEFDYDVSKGKYDKWDKNSLAKYRGLLEQKEQLQAKDEADSQAKQHSDKVKSDNESVQKKIAEIEKTLALMGTSNALVKLDYEFKHNAEYANVSDANKAGLRNATVTQEFVNVQRDLMPQETPAEKLRREYDERMAIVNEYAALENANLVAVNEAKMQIEKQYADAKDALLYQQTSAMMQSYQNAFGGLTSFAKDALGEQSTTYKAMFAMQKAMAISEAGMNLWRSASKAYAEEPGSVWQKAAAAAKAVVTQGQFMALIKAASPKGFATGGYTGNMGVNQVAGVVHGQEYVLNAQATKRIGVSNLNAMNNGGTIGGTNVVVNVAIHGDKDSSQTQSNSQDGMALGEALSAAIRKVILQEKRQGGLLA
ncbi:MAG: hypothetical protein Q4D05_06175 [Acinetobacter sp.]|nr:hypothetical protein [Acinetobacter sp.]